MPDRSTPTAELREAAACGSIAKDLGDQYRELYGAQQIVRRLADADTMELAVVPKGREIVSLKKFADEYRDRPERRAGTAQMKDVESFIAFVNRFRDGDSAVFADPNRSSPSLTAVLDYHERVNTRLDAVTPGEAVVAAPQVPDAKPRFGKHRAVYAFPLSDEWKAWTAKNAHPMSQADFAAFLEDRLGDVQLVDPERDEDVRRFLATFEGTRVAGPSHLYTLARNLSLNVETKVKQAITLGTGEVSVVYEEQHKDGEGAPVSVPNLFFIAIPVFYAGAPYRIPARLRYRVREGKITWHYQLVRPELAFDDAFQGVCDQVRAGTGLPLFVGAPES